MTKCEQCGKEVELPFECNFCGHYFCIEHRLPENHKCPNQPPRTPLRSWQTRKEMAYAPARKEKEKGKFASEGDYHFIRRENTKQPYEKRSSYGRYTQRMYKKIGYVLIIICGIILSIVGFPFAVVYESTAVPFLGEYQLHTIAFLGSPIYTWSTWNAVLGPIEFFIAFVLNTLTCFIILLILSAML